MQGAAALQIGFENQEVGVGGAIQLTMPHISGFEVVTLMVIESTTIHRVAAG